MLSRLIDFSLKNRLLIVLLFAAISSVGLWRLSMLPVDAFPDTTPVQVQINTVAPALNPEEIEQQITLPIELSIGGLPGLVNVRSVSKFGFSQVVATFDDDSAMIDARQYVFERINAVELPEGVELPKLGPIATGLGEVFHFIVRSESPTRTLEELRTIHDWVIKPELRKVPGVAEVNSWGGEVRQYHVVVSPTALLKYQLTLDEVYEALEENNSNVGGGLLTASGVSQMVHGLGRVTNIEQIENILIAAYDGNPIRVRDIAEEVKIDHEIRRGAVTADGRGEAVLGLAFMLMGENSQVVTENLKSQLDQVRAALPEDVILEVVYDRTELTTSVIGTVQHNLLLGAVLVIFVLFFLLGNFRAGLLVAIIIPLAMLLAVLGMYEFAIAASLLSLGAIDFGIIIDGSVVMTEANLRNFSKRSQQLGRKLTPAERLQTTAHSAKQVARPIVFGLGIIMIVFLPILTLEGIEGKMFKPMAWTFIFALLGALVLALTLSPVLSYYFLPRAQKHQQGVVERAMLRAYTFCLIGAMKARQLVLITVVLLLALTGWQATRLGGVFLPRLSEGALVLNIIRLAGISIDQSTAYNTRIEQLLKTRFPDEIRHVWSRIGTAEVATDPMGTELTDIFVSLRPRDDWSRAKTQAELVTAMQEEVADLPGLNLVFTQPIEMRLNEMVSGIRTDLGIKVYGDDFDELVRISDDIQRVLLQIPGASDIAVDQLTGQPTLQVRVDQQAIARYGVPARDVLQFVEAVGGRKVGEIYEGQRHFDLVARLPNEHRTDPKTLANTIVPTEIGQRLLLRTLATIEETEGSATISREWGRRLIRVQCNIAGHNVTSFIDEAKQRIDQEVLLPDGYVVEWGGQFENLERARNRLTLVVPGTLFLVFLLLFFSMKNLRDVLLIYTGIPFALIGGVFALWLRDIPFSVSAVVGFIALSGIAVLNGQILVVAIRGFIGEGQAIGVAVMNAAQQRLKPVLATVVIGGVVTSTVLTLIVLPILYAIIGKSNAEDKE
jgi:cobalt-zinc-cadmium resistance protein CzcA